MLRVMLVDTERTRFEALERALETAGHMVVSRLHSFDDLLTEINRVQPDVVIIDIDSPDRDVLDSMQAMNATHPRPVVMFTDDDDPTAIKRAVKAGVSAYIVDGLNPDRIKPIVDLAVARFEEFQKMRTELDEVKATLADRKVIEKAKGVLMKRSNIDEETAYKTMRKLAMDRNMRLADLAGSLIAAAELLE